MYRVAKNGKCLQKAGVNIEAGYEAVEKIKKHTERTHV